MFLNISIVYDACINEGDALYDEDYEGPLRNREELEKYLAARAHENWKDIIRWELSKEDVDLSYSIKDSEYEKYKNRWKEINDPPDHVEIWQMAVRQSRTKREANER